MTNNQLDLGFSTASANLPTPSGSDGQSLKMSPVCSARMQGGTLLRWLESYLGPQLTFQEKAGQMPVWRLGQKGSSNGAYWIRNTSVWRSGASVSSLSEILETGPVDRRYFLSAKACLGILRRAAKRGKELPPPLKAALEEVARMGSTPRVDSAKPRPLSRPAKVAGGGLGTDFDCDGGLIARPLHCNHEAPIAFQPRIARNGRGNMGDAVNALNAQSGQTGKGDAAPCVAFKPGQSVAAGGIVTDEHSPTLQSQNNRSTAVPCVAFRAAGQERFTPSDIAPPVAASDGGGSGAPTMQQGYAVRRLMPVECEKLQGFPPGWLIGSDSQKYKQLGNAVSVPVSKWLGERIARYSHK